MNFTVIDFETANAGRASACALGIVKVVDGKIKEKRSWLIRPIDMKFAGMNIAIHGIRPEDVEDEPEFDELYDKEFAKYFKDELIVAHNASFDMSVLRYSFDLYDIKYPEFDYLCTVKVAQKTWCDLYNHKLDTVSKMLNFKFKHHDALDDSLACANLLIKACEQEGVKTPYELAGKLGIKIGKVYERGYIACSASNKIKNKK